MKITPYDLFSGLPVNESVRDQSIGHLLVAGDLYAGGRAEKKLMLKEANLVWGDLIEEMEKHDLSIVNLECPLTDNRESILKTGPNLWASPECAAGIRLGGFDVASLANNHIKDMGDTGVIDTLVSCERAGLKTVGAGRNLKEATQPLFVEFNGLRICVLAIAEQEFSIASRDSAGAWPLDIIDNFHQIQNSKKQADFALVIFHGGIEYYSLPRPSMVKICRFFVEAGADGVICHHRHVPSGLEVYRAAPIIYSTGNFLFDWQHANTNRWYTGYVVSLEIQKDAVIKVRLIPYVQSKDECLVKQMSASKRDEFLSDISDLSAIIQEENLLLHEYNKFVSSHREKYLAIALSLSDIESRLLERGIWPFWRTSPKQLARLRNSYTCDSHYDLIVSVLDSELFSTHS